MPLSDTAKNAMLDAITPNRIFLHSGDPGSDGSSNQIGSLTTAAFDAASGGVRQLSADVDFSGLGAGADVLYYSIWNATGPTFLGSTLIGAGDHVASSGGNYTLLASGTAISIP